MTAANEAVARRYYEQMCNERKNELATELFTADHVMHDPQVPAGPARIVAAGARVLAVPPAETTDPTGGALIVVAVPPATAADVASAAGTSRLSVTVRPAPTASTTSPDQPPGQTP